MEATAGDPVVVAQTFESVFHAEYSKMVALAAAVSRSRRDAEDIAQEAMSRLQREWATVGGYDKPGAWLRRVTINLALSQRRRLARDAKVLLGLGAAEPALPEPPSSDAMVWAAVDSLPGKQRAVVALRFIDGLSTSEIADVLGMAEATVRVHQHRARITLRVALEGERGEGRPEDER